MLAQRIFSVRSTGTNYHGTHWAQAFSGCHRISCPQGQKSPDHRGGHFGSLMRGQGYRTPGKGDGGIYRMAAADRQHHHLCLVRRNPLPRHDPDPPAIHLGGWARLGILRFDIWSVSLLCPLSGAWPVSAPSEHPTPGFPDRPGDALGSCFFQNQEPVALFPDPCHS